MTFGSTLVLFSRVGIALAAAALYLLYRTDFGIDDAWITYRYAENLSAGLGFVYNSGERVLGTSTPLYTLLLAALRWLGLPLHPTSQFIGFCAMLATLHGVFLLGKRLHSAQAGLLGAALLVTMQVFHRVVTYGMETSLYVCLIVYAFYYFAIERRTLAVFFAALCLLLRLDGLAVAAAIGLSLIVDRRRFAWSPLALYAALYLALVLPWFAFSYAYFGSVLPNSMIAKQAHTQHQILTWMPEWLMTQSYSVLALIGASVCLSQERARWTALSMVVWAGAYVTAYTLSFLQGYEWYRTPLTVPLALFSAIGLLEVGQALFADRRVRTVAIAAIVAWMMVPDMYRLTRRLQGDWDLLAVEAVRFEAAHQLKETVPSDAIIAVGGIGHVGYFTRNYILDAMGLVSPQVISTSGVLASAEQVPIPRFLEASVKRYKPEYVFDGFWLPPGQDMPEFMQDDYGVVRRWQAGGPGFPTFMLYRRITQHNEEIARPR